MVPLTMLMVIPVLVAFYQAEMTEDTARALIQDVENVSMLDKTRQLFGEKKSVIDGLRYQIIDDQVSSEHIVRGTHHILNENIECIADEVAMCPANPAFSNGIMRFLRPIIAASSAQVMAFRAHKTKYIAISGLLAVAAYLGYRVYKRASKEQPNT